MGHYLISSDTKIIPLKGYDLVTSERTAKLLYVSNDDPGGASFGLGVSLTVDLIGGTVNVRNLPATEPSTLFTRLAVRQPHDPDTVPRPNYYPTYAELAPEQKWIYLNWLRRVSEPVNIGYVFIYYYGLERQLLLGEFDLAFEEILHLRSHHQHPSFLSYSGSALLHSCVIRKRLDKLEYLNQTGTLVGLGNAELLIAYQLGFDLSAKGLINASRGIRGINRRYIKSNESLFEMALEECLRAKYGDSYFPFASRYQIKDLPRKPEMLFANVSFPREIRTPELPSFLDYTPFLDEVSAVLAEAHETVKTRLKESRRHRQ